MPGEGKQTQCGATHPLLFFRKPPPALIHSSSLSSACPPPALIPPPPPHPPHPTATSKQECHAHQPSTPTPATGQRARRLLPDGRKGGTHRRRAHPCLPQGKGHPALLAGGNQRRQRRPRHGGGPAVRRWVGGWVGRWVGEGSKYDWWENFEKTHPSTPPPTHPTPQRKSSTRCAPPTQRTASWGKKAPFSLPLPLPLTPSASQEKQHPPG